MTNVYADLARPLFGRVLSTLDAEPTSPSQGSFDRTWWCWKFTDFSAPRFQEGAFTLAWLATSDQSPVPRARRDKLIGGTGAAIKFWSRLQHSDGSFDEAYPYERSLAATAFTGFYLGSAVERLGDALAADDRAIALRTLERGANWLSANGEYHGILSNHLAATAGALQIAGDVLGTDRFIKARDRYLGIIYKNQHEQEGWMREYGGADPGYQSHGMFYLADIERRSGDGELFERLIRAADFLWWFVHPDGTIGGEYASRGTKFAYPAAFEMLAARIPSAASIATYLRDKIGAGQGVSAMQMDSWNQFPMLNNLLVSADALAPIASPEPLPWQRPNAQKSFNGAGLVVSRVGAMVIAAGGRMGGSLKAWNADTGTLLYEDCGYASVEDGKPLVTQGDCDATLTVDGQGGVTIVSDASFHGIPTIRFDPWRFVGFRLFTLTAGRMPVVARWLKKLLVRILIREKSTHSGRLTRAITITADKVEISDHIVGLSSAPQPLARHVPFHMGSSRYAELQDWLGAMELPHEPVVNGTGAFSRTKVIASPA